MPLEFEVVIGDSNDFHMTGSLLIFHTLVIPLHLSLVLFLSCPTDAFAYLVSVQRCVNIGSVSTFLPCESKSHSELLICIRQ